MPMKFIYNDVEWNYFDEGAFGAVFSNPNQTRVIKVFMAMTIRDFAVKTFKNEVEAYNICAKSEFANLIPCFHGEVKQDLIIDSIPEGHQGFHNDLAYEIDFIKGKFVKIGAVIGDQYPELLANFSTIGINYLSDCSVILDGAKITKIIDFGVRELPRNDFAPYDSLLEQFSLKYAMLGIKTIT